jgi:outer membrane receptor protein involved in Fe transport
MLLFLLVFLPTVLFGQSLIGTVSDEKNEPLPFVNIYIPAISSGGVTDFDGNFNLSVPTDTIYEVRFSFVSFEEQVVYMHPNQTINVTLLPRKLELQEFEIISESNKESDAVLLMERKDAIAIVQNIGKQTMDKKALSVSDAVNKTVGVTYDRNIFVRGLGDRYNQITLNGLVVPSPNPDQKNIDLSILPKLTVSNISISKNYSTDNYSEATGAQININTRQISGNSIGVSLGGNMNTNTIYPSGRLNIDIQKKWKGFGLYFGYLYRIQNNVDTGFVSMVNKQGAERLNYSIVDSNMTHTNSGMLSLSYNNKWYSLNTVTLVSDIRSDSYRYTNGTHFDYSRRLTTTRNTPEHQTLFLQQINNSFFHKKHTFVLNGSYSMIDSGEDNREQFVYIGDGQLQFNKIDKLDNHLFNSTNTETNYQVNGSYKFTTDKYIGEIGVSELFSQKDFDFIRYYYDVSQTGLVDDVINPEQYDTVRIDNPESNTYGTQNIFSTYIDNKLRLGDWNIRLGFRLATTNQSTYYRIQTSPHQLRKTTIEQIDFIPSLITKYTKDKHSAIASFSRTVNRPRFRELTPFEYTEFFAGNKIVGNPELQPSYAYNADLSYQYYIKDGLFAVSAFYKYIESPIERINLATASGRLESYQNGYGANVAGVELEFSKKFDRLQLDANVTYIWSEIRLSDTSNVSVVVTNLKRELQGSTPLIINLDVFYDWDIISTGITYNYNHRQLHSVGIQGMNDIYQDGFHSLNLVGKVKLKRISFSASINNILNQSFRLVQQVNDDEMVLSEINSGIGFSFGVKVDLGQK